MHRYSSLSDDFYINMNLSTEMELSSSRDSVLHYFEQIQKRFPEMRNFYCRDKGDFVLEEDKDRGQYRWCTIEPRRVCSGQVNPDSTESVLEQHQLVLDLAPPLLSVSRLDCEALDLLFGFDFTYRGNHNELVRDALGVNPSVERLAELPGATVINYEPSITLSLDDECRTQCRLSIETRTNAYQIRTGEFTEDQLSVYITARQYGSLEPKTSYGETLDNLATVCFDLLDRYVVEQVLRPLAQTIALK